MNPYLRVDDEGIHSSFCDELRVFFCASDPQVIDEDWRRCKTISFGPENYTIFPRFQEWVRSTFREYQKYLGDDSLGAGTLNYITRVERPSMFLYEPDSEKQNHFHMHADCWNSDSATRQLSIIAYLTDVAEGGETIFPNVNRVERVLRPKKGRVAIFPSHFSFMHLAKPPISDPKLILVSWLHFGPNTTYTSYPL